MTDSQIEALDVAKAALSGEDNDRVRAALTELYEAVAGEPPAVPVTVRVRSLVTTEEIWKVKVPVDHFKDADAHTVSYLLGEIIDGDADFDQTLNEDVQTRDVTHWEVD